MDSVGDLARTLVLRTNQTRLRQDMDRLAVEVATGFVRDPAGYLQGDTTSLLAIDRALARLDVFRINTAEAVLVTGTMQTALDEIQSRSETLSQSLISAELTPNSSLLATLSEDARNTLSAVMNGLNRSVAGRFLFSGAATDRQALQSFDQLMTDLRTAVSGQTTLEGVNSQLEGFFGPGGDYETVSYQGSLSGLAPLQLSDREQASVDIRATDQAFREILKPMAMAALASDPSLGFTSSVKIEMLAQAGRDLLGAQQSIVELRANLGMLEARVEESTTRNSAERTSLSIARLELVGVDDFETATRYEAARSQLESLYAITARSQRLSLADYL